MNLLMTADPVGGVWTYALELTRALRRHDVAVSLASIGARLTGDQRREAREAGVERLFATDLALEWMNDRWGEVEACGEWLLDVRDRAEPDVVHLNGYVHAALPWVAPVVVVAHSCVVSWYESVRRHRPPPGWDRYAEAVERGLQAADLVVSPTRTMLEALRRHYRFDTERTVIANGVRPIAELAKEPLVLAVGRAWDEAKNIAAVERAAPRLAWDVRVVGPGSRGGPLRRSALAREYGRASVFCHPARYEPFGLAPLEAAHASCALVLGAIESLEEVWGDAAVYVDPDDDEALAAAVTRLIDDRCLRAELAARARVRAAAYSPARMAEGYLDAYERVTSRRLEAAVA